MLVLCLGGELDTGFVLPGIFSDDNPAPSAPADALHWSFPDGAVIEHEPENGALKATGIQTATIRSLSAWVMNCTIITLGKTHYRERCAARAAYAGGDLVSQWRS